MIVGFTGTSHGVSPQQKRRLRELLLSFQAIEPVMLHHGDCIGADAEAHRLCQDLDIDRVVHPPDNPRARAMCGLDEVGILVLPKKPYLERNHDIVDACEALIAAPRTAEEERRSGTWATVRYARKQNKPIYIIAPNGTVAREGTR